MISPDCQYTKKDWQYCIPITWVLYSKLCQTRIFKGLRATGPSEGKSKKLRIIQRKPYQRSATFEDCLSLNQKDLIYKIEDLFSGFFSESFIKVRVRLSNYNFELLFFFLKLDVKAIKVFWFFAICMLGTARRKTCKEWKLSSDVNLCFFC